MIWLYITIIAYLLFALANIGDKLVVSKFKTSPIVYAFYVGTMGIMTVFLIPFGVIWPNFIQIFWSLSGGVAFVIAAFFMYKAIYAGETTKAITIMGSTAPIFTFLMSYWLLSERLTSYQLFSFFILVLAIIVISWEFDKKKKTNKPQVFWAILAGLAFAASYVLAKYVYLFQPFISGFVWIRIGGFLTALFILLIPHNRQLIKKDWQQPKKQKGSLILLIQILGGIGVVGQNYAFTLASATLINALQAIQYAAVFVFASLLGKKIPQLKEDLNYKQIIQKIIAIFLIAIGLYFIVLK